MFFGDSIYNEIKAVMNYLLIATGLGATFFADFTSIASKLVRLSFVQSVSEPQPYTLEEIDLITAIIMRIFTGVGTVLISYLVYRHTVKKSKKKQ